MTFNWSTKSSPRRGSDPVRLAVLHTAEGARSTDSLEAWFMRDDVEASSHSGADDAGLLDMVPFSRAAWTIRRANSISDNLEMCGFAAWSREEWLRHSAMLDHAAAWLRARCAARGIPFVKLTPAQVAAGESGVCGHVDWTMATRLQGDQDGTHTDPGPNFPWDVVMGDTTPPVKLIESLEESEMAQVVYPQDNPAEKWAIGTDMFGHISTEAMLKAGRAAKLLTTDEVAMNRADITLCGQLVTALKVGK